MNIVDGGVVTSVDFDADDKVGFADIVVNGRALYVQFPIEFVQRTTCIGNNSADPQWYVEWDVEIDCPVIAGDVVLYTWQGSADDFTEGKILLDKIVLEEIEWQLEVKAAEIALDCGDEQ